MPRKVQGKPKELSIIIVAEYSMIYKFVRAKIKIILKSTKLFHQKHIFISK